LRPQFALRACALGGFQKNPTHPKKLQHIAVSKNMMQK